MKTILPLTALLALVGTANASGKISAQSIIVNPVQTNVAVRVWTDRDSSGNSTPNYAPGDQIHLYTSVNQDAYVYLFNVDPAGRVDMILPNPYAGGANYLKANTTKVFPAANDGFTFDIAAPYGLNKVLALASTTPLNLEQLAQFRTQQGSFQTPLQGQQQLAQALSIVVNPVAQNTWTSDTAYYNVVGGRTVTQPTQPPVRTPVYRQPNQATGNVTVQPNYVQPAPVQTAPVRPVRRAPVQNAPVQTTPAQVTFPWLNLLNWNITLQFGNSNMSTVHEQYASQLRSQGYRLVDIHQNGYNTYSNWQRGGETARLTVTLRGNQYQVNIVRR